MMRWRAASAERKLAQLRSGALDLDSDVGEGEIMSRVPVLVGSRIFALKKDAEEACRNILYRYRPGDRIAETF